MPISSRTELLQRQINDRTTLSAVNTTLSLSLPPLDDRRRPLPDAVNTTLSLSSTAPASNTEFCSSPNLDYFGSDDFTRDLLFCGLSGTDRREEYDPPINESTDMVIDDDHSFLESTPPDFIEFLSPIPPPPPPPPPSSAWLPPVEGGGELMSYSRRYPGDDDDLLIDFFNNSSDNHGLEYMHFADELEWDFEIVDYGAGDDHSRSGNLTAAKNVVENLPLVALTKEDLKDGVGVCAICANEVVEGDTVNKLPCSHYYHGDCILPWLKINNTCPLCRYELPTDSSEHESYSWLSVTSPV